MQLLSRFRFALARRPWVYWLMVACCAAFVWSTVSAAQTRLDDERRRWGETRTVWVAAVDIVPGDVMRTVAREYPIAMLPANTIREQPIGIVATSAISAGEVLVATDVDESIDDAVPTDWVVFAFTDIDTPTLRAGDTVVIFGSGQRLCEGVVIGTVDGDTDIAVPDSCADAVSVHITTGDLILGLTRQ